MTVSDYIFWGKAAVKFRAGDKIDVEHCKALQHEFLRCHHAFIEYCAIATRTITDGEDRFTAYRMYNAYARFLHHLYEFMAGSLARDIHDTRIAKTNEEARNAIEKYIMGHAVRLLRNKRQAIDNVKAPGWEQALATLPTTVPPEFAKSIREHRNIVSGHVNYARASLSLHEFYQSYHFYMFLLYRDAYSWWGRTGGAIPDLDEITKFSALVRQQPPAPTVE